MRSQNVTVVVPQGFTAKVETQQINVPTGAQQQHARITLSPDRGPARPTVERGGRYDFVIAKTDAQLQRVYGARGSVSGDWMRLEGQLPDASYQPALRLTSFDAATSVARYELGCLRRSAGGMPVIKPFAIEVPRVFDDQVKIEVHCDGTPIDISQGGRA